MLLCIQEQEKRRLQAREKESTNHHDKVGLVYLASGSVEKTGTDSDSQAAKR